MINMYKKHVVGATAWRWSSIGITTLGSSIWNRLVIELSNIYLGFFRSLGINRLMLWNSNSRNCSGRIKILSLLLEQAVGARPQPGHPPFQLFEYSISMCLLCRKCSYQPSYSDLKIRFWRVVLSVSYLKSRNGGRGHVWASMSYILVNMKAQNVLFATSNATVLKG